MALLPVDNGEFSVEIRADPPTNVIFKIQSFSKLLKHEIPTHESRAFVAGNCKWKLVLHPKNQHDHISLYLYVVDTHILPVGWEVKASCSILLHNQISNNYFCFRGKEQRFDANNSKWGFSISKRMLTEPSNGYLVNDDCVFGAEVLTNQTPTIESFSLLDWKISNFSKLEGVWTSKEFLIGGLRWKMDVYPKGNGRRADGKSVSIYLNCVDCNNFASREKVEADFCIRVKNKLSHAHISKSASHCFEYNGDFGWGFSNFMPIKDIVDPSKGFIVDDCFSFETQISVRDVVYTPKQEVP